MKNSVDFDLIISQLMENESLAKNLTDDEYKKIIDFLKDYLFDFILKISKSYSEEKIIKFSENLIKSFTHNNVDAEINILKSFIQGYRLTYK